MHDAAPQVNELTPERLAEVVGRLVAELSPRRVYLFGSFAYGTPGPDSDIDVMIVVADTEALSPTFLKRAHRCLRAAFLPIELHFRRESTLNRRSSVPTSLEHEIVTKGQLLYAA